MFDENEEKPGLNLQDYWAIVRRRRWWLLLPIFAVWAIAFAISYLLPAQYRSETLILIEQQKVPEQYVVANVSMSMQERLQSMTQQILSRTRLQRIIDQFGLYRSERNRLGPDAVVERMRKDIQIELVQPPGERQDLTAFRIFYLAPNPQVAQQVASRLTSLFIDENIQTQQQLSEDTTAFLANQLEDARKNLAEQETKVREFKARYLGQLPSQLQSNVQILTGLESRSQSLSQALSHAQQQKLYLESLRSQYHNLQGASEEVAGDTVPALDKELARLNSELAAARGRYTENHPDVTRLKSEIAKTEKLKQQIESQIAAKQDKPADSPKGKRATSTSQLQGTTPMLQVEGELKANELEIRDTQRELNAVQAQIGEYQARLNVTPMREQQMADLTRDYEQSKSNYDSLLKKQMQSQLATNLEKRQQGQQFRILDPPSLPLRPYFPDRVQFSMFGLLCGVLLGCMVVAALEMFDARICSERQLHEVLSAKVLVGIPHISTPQEQRRMALLQLGEWSAALVMLAIVVGSNALLFYKR
jgi:polysaccharide biosynthesis transport protein